MSTATSAVPAPTDRWPPLRRPVVWYGAFAAYAVAALVAARWRDAALMVSVVGGLVAPVVWLATRVTATPDVRVVARSASLLLHHGTPYLPAGQMLSSIDYN